MKLKEINELKQELSKASVKDLEAKRLDYKKELVILGLQAAGSNLQNSSRITYVRKAIARVETALAAKANAAE